MNIFRNKFVVIGLGVVALAMLANSLKPMWQRGRGSAPKKSAAAQPQVAPAAQPQVAPAAPASTPVPPSAVTPPAARTQAEAAFPEQRIDLDKVGWSFNGAPRRDPFQMMGPAPGNLARL